MKKYLEYCENVNNKMNDKFLSDNKDKNFILYGNNKLNNYVSALVNLKNLSKSELKYSRRIVINFNNEEVLFNISDIHFEVDFELLGVNQFHIFLTLFHHVKDNMLIDKHLFYIVCLNFQEIKLELMNIFYSFLNDSKIKFILLTNEISFLCEKIIKSSLIKKIKGKKIYISNGQKENIESLTSMITDPKKNSLFLLREQLYVFLTLNYNIHTCFANVIFRLIEIQYITEKNINFVFKKYNEFTEKYNNNYRPIYHLESFIIFLINLKNKQEKE